MPIPMQTRIADLDHSILDRPTSILVVVLVVFG